MRSTIQLRACHMSNENSITSMRLYIDEVQDHYCEFCNELLVQRVYPSSTRHGGPRREEAMHFAKRRFCDIECSNASRTAAAKVVIDTRFWSKVDKTDSCWLWRGTLNAKGYGVFWANQKNNAAHRFSFELTNEPINDGGLVCHKCDNPPCVRPDHLFLGTSADNMEDMVAKGRSLTGGRNNAAVLTEAQVREIRALYSTDNYYQTELATKFGVSQSAIWLIVKNKKWQHVK